MNKLISLLFTCLLTLLVVGNTDAQDVLLNGNLGTITTDERNFYDAGGTANNYSSTSGNTYEVTFCPDTPDKVTHMYFNDYGIRSDGRPDVNNFGNFKIYDGTGTNARLLFNNDWGANTNSIYHSGPEPFYIPTAGNQDFTLPKSTWWAGMSGMGDGTNCLTVTFNASTSTYVAQGWDARVYSDKVSPQSNNNGCNATPLDLGFTLEDQTNKQMTRTCNGGGHYTSGSINSDFSSGHAWYSFVTPTSGTVTLTISPTPSFPDGNDEFSIQWELLYISDCGECSTTYIEEDSGEAASGITSTTDLTGLESGRQYYVVISGKEIATAPWPEVTTFTTQDCDVAGVFTGSFDVTVDETNPCIDHLGNTVFPPGNDEFCQADTLMLECFKRPSSSYCATNSECDDPPGSEFIINHNGTDTPKGTVYFNYYPEAREFGKEHTISLDENGCYTTGAAIELVFAVWELTESSILPCNHLPTDRRLVARAQYPNALSFTPTSGKVYLLGVATTKTGTSCNFYVDMSVYDRFSINSGIPSQYICDFPVAATASLEFYPEGGTGVYEVAFETSGDAVGTWSGGDAETTTAQIDTVYGNEKFTITGIEDGDTWKVTFDDGIGCTYTESGIYDYDLWCNICDDYTKLDIVIADTAVCPGETVFLEPYVDAATTKEFNRGMTYTSPFKDNYTSASRIYSYNNDGTNGGLPDPQLAFNEDEIFPSKVQVKGISFKAFSYYWNYIKVDIQVDGVPVTIWNGIENGGSDRGISTFGHGFQTFTIDEGWYNNTYNRKVASDWDNNPSVSILNTAWEGKSPETPIEVVSTSSPGSHYAHFYTYEMTVNYADRIPLRIAGFKAGEELNWNPYGLAPSISDGSELTFDTYENPDKTTATFMATTPGRYIYNLVGDESNGCEVGAGVDHGGVDNGVSVKGNGTFEIKVYQPPVINSIAYENTLCAGGSTELIADVSLGDNATDAIFGHQWAITSTTGDAVGFLTNENTVSTKLLTNGSGTINFSFTTTDGRGCGDVYTGTITINPECPADSGSY